MKEQLDIFSGIELSQSDFSVKMKIAIYEDFLEKYIYAIMKT